MAGGLVWTISQGGTLYGLDPGTGQVRQQAGIGTPANHFPTPGAGAGLLLAPASNRVVAFRVGAAGSSPASTAPASTHPSAAVTSRALAGSNPPSAGLSGGAIAGIVIGSLAVLSVIGWLVWRRVPNRS